MHKVEEVQGGEKDGLKWDSSFEGQPMGIQGKKNGFHIKQKSPVQV